MSLEKKKNQYWLSFYSQLIHAFGVHYLITIFLIRDRDLILIFLIFFYELPLMNAWIFRFSYLAGYLAICLRETKDIREDNQDGDQ